MLEPLMDRRAKLERTKRLHQFLRDIEDEKIWISEKMLLAQSTNYGNSLLSVQMLQKKNKSLRNEIDSHEPRIISVVDLGLAMIEEGHPQSEEFQDLINDLNARWSELIEAVEKRKNRLELSEQTQQVLYNVQSFLYNVQSFLYNVQSFLYNVQSFLYNVHSFLYIKLHTGGRSYFQQVVLYQ